MSGLFAVVVRLVPLRTESGVSDSIMTVIKRVSFPTGEGIQKPRDQNTLPNPAVFSNTLSFAHQNKHYTGCRGTRLHYQKLVRLSNFARVHKVSLGNPIISDLKKTTEFYVWLQYFNNNL